MSHLKLVTSATSSDGTAYAEAIEDLDAGVCIVDRDGSVLASNQAFCRLLDLPPDWADPKANKTPIPASEQLVTGWLARVASQGGFAETVALSGRFVVQIVGKALPSGGVSLTLSETAEKSVPVTGVTKQSVPQWVLHDAEENFRGVVENMADVYYHSDLQGNTTFGGPAIGRLLGYEPEEFEALDWRVLHVDPDRRVTFLEELERNGGQIRDFEAAFRHKNGEAVWLSSNIRYRYGDDGGLLGIEGVIRNISEQKSTQAALRASDAQLRAIVDNSSAMILLKGLDGRFQFVGKQFVAAYGVPIKGAIGKTSHEVLLGKFVDMAVEQDQQVIDTGEPIQEEITAPFADGTKHVLLSSKFPVRDDEGDIVGVGAINTDITDRVEDRRALAESEGRFRALLAHSPDSVSLKDSAGRFLVANKECERVLGVSVDDMLGRTVWEILPDGDWHNSDASDAQVLNGEVEVCNDEVSVDVPGRGRRVLRRTKFPVLDSDSRPIGVGTITTDVTERTQAREQLRRNEAGLKNAQRLARMGNVERNFVTGETYWSDGVFAIFEIEKRPTVPDFDEIREHIHPDDRVIYDDMLSAMYGGETSQKVDFRLISASGEVRYVHELLEAYFGDDGDVTHCVAVIQDVTEAKLAEEALRKSEQRFHSMIDNLPSAVSVKDRDHRFVVVNKSFETLYGRTKDSVVGEPLVSAMPENNDWEPIIAADQEILDGDRATYEEMLTLRFEDGEKRNFNLRKFSVTDDNGDISAVGTISTDITDRVAAEQALSESEGRFRSLVDNLPNTVTVKGLDGRFTLVNAAFAQTVGQPPDEIIGQTIGDVIPDMDVEWSDSMDVRICNGEDDFITEEYSVMLPNGEQRYIHMTKFPVRESGGECTGVGTILTDLTARRRAEEGLRRSEHGFRNAQRIANMGHWERDLVSGEVSSSEEACRIIGIRPGEQFALDKFFAKIHPDDADNVKEKMAKLQYGQGAFDMTFRIFDQDGEVRNIRDVVETDYDEDGRAIRISGVIQDITERVRAEERVRESEEKFHAIFEQAGLGIGLVGRDGDFVDVNSEMAEMFGLTRDEMTKESIGSLTVEDDLERSREQFNALLNKENDIARFEKRYLRKGRAPFDASLVSTTVFDEDGEFKFTVALIDDITERKKSERALRESEERLRAITDNSPAAIYLKDTEGRYIFANQVWHDTYNPAGEDIAGKPMDDFMLPEVAKQAAAADAKVQETGVPIVEEQRLPTAAGIWQNVLASKFPVRDEDGNVVAIGGVNTDISDRVAAERALLDSEEHLAHAQRIAKLGSWVWDLNTDKVTWSDALYRLMQIDPASAADPVDAFYARIHPDDQAGVERSREKLKQIGNQELMPFRIILPSGEERIIHTQWVVEHDTSGQPVRAIGITQDVTEANKAEEALRVSEGWMRALIDNLPNGISLKDAEQKFIHLNERAAEIFQLPENEVLGQTSKELLSREQLALFSEADRDIIGGHLNNYSDILAVDQSDGQQHIYNLTKFAVLGEDGSPMGVGTISTDITEATKAEEALRESEERFRTMIDNLPSAVTLRDRDHRYVLVNRAFGEVYARDPQEVLGRRSQEVFPAREWSDVEEVDEKLFCGEIDLFEHEYELEVAEGDTRLYTMTKFPVIGSGGEVANIGTISTDITESRRAELALRESEQWFRAVVDNVPATLTLKNRDGTFRYVNKQFRDWYDLTLEQVIGCTGDELFPDETSDAVRTLDKAVVETGDAVQAEVPVTFADGSAHTLLANKFLVRDDDGAVIGNGLVGYDVTDSKNTEEMLRQAQKMEAVGQLTGGVAHDFNNLLAVVIGNLEMVADHLQADTPAFNFVRSAFTAAERGASLTHHLLAFSRQQVLRPVNTDLAKLIADTRDLMSVSIGEKVTMELKADDDLWLCQVDQAQLQNAILNLSINARDAMPSGGDVTISAENVTLDTKHAEALELDAGDGAGDYVCLSVSDNGPGIPADVLEHVYEPFFTTKDVGEGSGLGLSMVYGFARQSGAGVEIETGEGEGTAVKIYFPAVVLDEPEAVEKIADTQAQKSEPDATILLVEDNAAFREITRAILESINFRVIDVGTAEEALAVIGDTTPFDLMLSDIGLPGDMDGHDLAQFAASARPGLKIILMSAHTDRAAAGGIIDGNVAAFLRKPHRKADLSQTLHRVLGIDS